MQSNRGGRFHTHPPPNSTFAIVLVRTVLSSETEHGDQASGVGERDAERYEVVERPLAHLRELGRDER